MNDTGGQLEKEYRVLLQSLNEGIALVPTKARGRFEATARYAQTRLESLVSPRALDRRSDNTQAAELAAEYWKLLRSLRRAIAVMPENARDKLEAGARYSEARLESILAASSMRILDFDGMSFDTGMPVVAINGDEFSEEEAAVIETTLEPSVIQGMAVLVTGKVFLVKA